MLCGLLGPGISLHRASSAICESKLDRPLRDFNLTSSIQRRDIFRLSPTRKQATPRVYFYDHAELTPKPSKVSFALYLTRDLCSWKSLYDGRSSDATTR
jgi:hypothetical protein